jgi:predicted phage terminase large subunit-like protein
VAEVAVDFLQVFRELTRRNLFECLQEVWKVVVPEEPVFNWHIEFLCNEIQEVYERVFANKDKEYDLLINIPPGTTKSTIVSVVAPIWAWTRMPSLRTIVSTHAFDLGLDLSRKGRQIALDPLFAEAHGLELKKDLNAKGHYGNLKGGERYVATVGGKNPMGKHAHVLIVDDPIDPEKVFSTEALKSANRYLTNTLPSRMVSKTLTPIILLMQRLHQNDPTGHLIKIMDKSGQPYRRICLPAEVTPDVYPPKLADRYVDGLLDPVRLPRRVLDVIRNTSQYTYASQYLQTPIPPEGGLFNVDKIEVIEPSDCPRIMKAIRYWDKAATEGAGANTAGAKLGKALDGRLVIMNVRAFKKDTAKREESIRNTAALDGKDVIIGMEKEGGSAGVDSIKASIAGLDGYTVIPDRPTGDKVVRADPFATQVNAGNVVMLRGDWNEATLEELRYFPHGTYKDRVDALTGAHKLLTGPLKIAKAVG